MELLRRQKNKIRAFGIFLAFMLLCTLISRSVYASGLPQVSTSVPAASALAHTVEAEGIVEAGRETAVTALSGLRCDTVLVHAGDHVDAGTALFQVDLEDLKEQIEEKQLAISKLQLEIQAQEQNRKLETEQKNEQKDRAREDYNAAKESSSQTVSRAEQDLSAAETALKEAEAAYEAWKTEQEAKTDGSEDAGVPEQTGQAETNAELETPEQTGKPDGSEDVGAPEQTGQAEADGTPETQAGQETEEKAEQETEPEPQTWSASEETNSGSVSSEDTADGMTEESWQEQLAALRQSVETAKRALEDAWQSRDSALSEAERAVEDADGESTADNSLEINSLDLSAQQKELKEYQDLLQADGMVYPEKDGIVTSVGVSPGERIPDGAAVVMADLDSPLQFSVSLTADQKKYVNQGDPVSLKLGSRTIEAVADYIAENEANPGTYQLTVFLEEGEGELGESGTLSAETRTDTYSCVVPLSAIFTDENQRKYVLVVEERSGILGAEFAARKVYVNVLDQNDSQAALEEGTLSGEEEVITDFTGEIEDGDVVRYKDEY